MGLREFVLLESFLGDFFVCKLEFEIYFLDCNYIFDVYFRKRLIIEYLGILKVIFVFYFSYLVFLIDFEYVFI